MNVVALGICTRRRIECLNTLFIHRSYGTSLDVFLRANAFFTRTTLLPPPSPRLFSSQKFELPIEVNIFNLDKFLRIRKHLYCPQSIPSKHIAKKPSHFTAGSSSPNFPLSVSSVHNVLSAGAKILQSNPREHPTRP